MQAIVERMQNPFTGFLAFMTGTTVTVTEIVTKGSLWITFIGAMLACFGGWWTSRTAKVKYDIELTKLKLAELEFARANDLGNGHPKRPHHPNRR